MKGKQEIVIEHPEAWELLVSLDDKRVRYGLFTPAVANSLHIGDIACTDDSLHGLEDAVYNTSLLLNEYKRVRVVVYPRHFLLLPQDVTDEVCIDLLHEAFPACDADVAVCLMPRNGVKIAFGMPSGTHAFLGRTFNYPAVIPHLVPLCEHCSSLVCNDNLKRMFLHLSESRLDMIIFNGDKMVCANSFSVTGPQDARYYALAAWRSWLMDQLNDELFLFGDNSLQATMTPLLREFVKQVKPAVFPVAAMRLGRNAMQAPFELMLLALCE